MSFSGVTLHLLEDVSEKVSSTQLRSAAAATGRRLEGLVGEGVAEYIRKTRLYRSDKKPEVDAPEAVNSEKKKPRP
jgi:nicotinic acid mononucleotide adenylyltransferase